MNSLPFPKGTRQLNSPRFRSIAVSVAYGGFWSGRPSMNVALTEKLWPPPTYSASDNDANGFLLVALSILPALVICTLSDDLTYRRPVSGSHAAPPQFAPPTAVGRCSVPSSDGGV